MAINSISRQGTTKHKPESRFQRLWATAAQLSKENAQLEIDLDKLVKRVSVDVFEAEQRLGETMRLAVLSQLKFAKRKTLSYRQRDTLADWIDEHLTFLGNRGMVDEVLQEKLAELRAFELGFEIESSSELSSTEQLNQFFEAKAETETKEEAAYWRQEDERVVAAAFATGDLFSEDAEQPSPDVKGLTDDELAELLNRLHMGEAGHKQNSPPPESHRPKSKPVSDDVFKRIFRQTAAALHPDKEPDKERHQEKHGLMTELLRARKEFDLITMLSLHEQHAKVDSNLNTADERALEQVLVEYLEQQQTRMDDIIGQSSMHHIAYHDFYSKSASTVTQKINAHIKRADMQRKSLAHFVDTVKNLKQLKAQLIKRYSLYW